MRGFFNVPQNYQHSRNCETEPPVYRPYPRRLESLTICRWNYKGSTFLVSYLKTLSVGPVGVSNSRPPASQPSAQPSKPPARGLQKFYVTEDKDESADTIPPTPLGNKFSTSPQKKRAYFCHTLQIKQCLYWHQPHRNNP